MRGIGDLGELIAEFLHDAAARGEYSRDELRELRGRLAHVVASDLGTLNVDEVRGQDVEALAADLSAGGLAPDRVRATVEALRPVFAYAIGRGRLSASPLVGLAPTGLEPRTPTDAMLQLGETLATWTLRTIVIASLVITVALAVALV